MTVNWGLAQNNALANFGYGVQLGQNLVDRREAREERNALLDLRREQQERLARQEESALQQQQRQERRAGMEDVAKLFEGVNEQNYGQRVQIAQQMGLDVSGVPQAYDPAWVEQQRTVFRFFAQRPEALSNAAKQAQDAGYDISTPEGQQVVRRIIEADLAQPYMGQQGETRLYTPQVFGGQQGPQPGAIEDGYRFNGGDPGDPNNWEPVGQGGPTQPASGGFRP